MDLSNIPDEELERELAYRHALLILENNGYELEPRALWKATDMLCEKLISDKAQEEWYCDSEKIALGEIEEIVGEAESMNLTDYDEIRDRRDFA